MEALTFLVNNLSNSSSTNTDNLQEGDPVTKDIDFKSLREAFRELDTENLGMLSMQEVK
jgi:hypothetical protein